MARHRTTLNKPTTTLVLTTREAQPHRHLKTKLSHINSTRDTVGQHGSMDHQDNTDISSNHTTMAGEAAHRPEDIMVHHREEWAIIHHNPLDISRAADMGRQMGSLLGSWGCWRVAAVWIS